MSERTRHAALITGAAGFVGSRVALRLKDLGWRVRALDRKPIQETAAADLGELLCVDLCSAGDELDEAVADVQLVVHAAAHTDLLEARKDPEQDFRDNVIATQRLFEAARRASPQPVVVYLSSFRVYGDNVDLATTRGNSGAYHLAGPYRLGISETFSTDQCERTVHGTHKLLGDLIAQEYASSFDIRVAVFRVGPLAGPGQTPTSDGCWLAALLGAAEDDLKQIDPNQLLDVLHVDDLVDAILAFVDSEWHHLVLNIGGGTRNAVRPHVLASALMGSNGKVKATGSAAEILATYPKVWITDIRRANRALGWTPQRDLEVIFRDLGVPSPMLEGVGAGRPKSENRRATAH